MSVGKLTRYGLPMSNVVATGTATGNLTPGRTLELLQLRMGGGTFTKAMITLVKFKANGRTLMEVSGPEMDKIAGYKGYTVNSNFLDLPFFDDRMTTYLDRVVSAFDTSSGVANITTEVTIAGATAPTLTPIIVESAAQRTNTGDQAPYSGLVGKFLRYPFSIANGGVLPVTVPFGKDSGAIIKRVYVFHSGNMTGATVKQDGMVVHESVLAENNIMGVRYGKVNQTNMYPIDFVLDGNVRNALDTRDARALEWLLSFSAADNGTIIVEYLDSLGNL